jgi:hypothetical protein
MRYFEGPESPPAPDKGYLLVVERWYVKLYAERDLSFQGRFLVESRRFGRGTVAVAPYDTTRVCPAPGRERPTTSCREEERTCVSPACPKTSWAASTPARRANR